MGTGRGRDAGKGEIGRWPVEISMASSGDRGPVECFYSAWVRERRLGLLHRRKRRSFAGLGGNTGYVDIEMLLRIE